MSGRWSESRCTGCYQTPQPRARSCGGDTSPGQPGRSYCYALATRDGLSCPPDAFTTSLLTTTITTAAARPSDPEDWPSSLSFTPVSLLSTSLLVSRLGTRPATWRKAFSVPSRASMRSARPAHIFRQHGVRPSTCADCEHRPWRMSRSRLAPGRFVCLLSPPLTVSLLERLIYSWVGTLHSDSHCGRDHHFLHHDRVLRLPARQCRHVHRRRPE